MERTITQTYCWYTACKDVDDLRHTASRSMEHALSAGLKQQHTGQVEDQSWVLRLLKLLHECLTMKEQHLSTEQCDHRLKIWIRPITRSKTQFE